MQGGFRDADPPEPAAMLTSTCPQPDQDEELPVGCGELAREGQPGWEGAPAVAPALEELCRLALSTLSSILQDREIQEVREPPTSTRTPTHTHLPCAMQPWPLFCQELVQCKARWVTALCPRGQPPQQCLLEVAGGGVGGWGGCLGTYVRRGLRMRMLVGGACWEAAGWARSLRRPFGNMFGEEDSWGHILGGCSLGRRSLGRGLSAWGDVLG